MKEETIETYTTKNFRLQLLKLTELDAQQLKIGSIYIKSIKYQVRLNRKIIQTSKSEYNMRKLFTIYVQNQVLQLKIY